MIATKRVLVVLGILLCCERTAVFAANRCTLQAAPSLSLEEAVEALVPTASRAAGADATGTVATGVPGVATIEGALIEGLTIFVTKRARQEVIAFILDLIQTKVCGNARAWFPLTCAQFTAASETQTAVVPGRALQDAVVADLRAVPWHFADQIDAIAPTLPAPQQTTAKRVSAILRAADDIVCGIEHHQPPLLLVAAAIARYDTELDLDVTSSKVMQLLMRLAANATAEDLQRWLDSPDRLMALAQSALRGAIIVELRRKIVRASVEVARTLPAQGLLLREAYELIDTALPALRSAGVTTESTAMVRTRLAELRTRAAALAGNASGEIKAVVTSLVNIVDHVIGAIEDPLNASTHVQAIAGLAGPLISDLKALETAANAIAGAEWQNLGTLAGTLRGATVLGALPTIQWRDLLSKADTVYRTYVEPIVPHALAVYAALRSHRAATTEDQQRTALRELFGASLGVVEALVIPALCTDANGARITECKIGSIASSASAAARAFLSGSYTSAIRHLLELFSLAGDFGQTQAAAELKRFGALFAEIATAKSGDEIAASLESAAAPLGSWRLRRKKMTYGLSARVGVAGGYEHLSRAKDEDANGGTFGLHMPILLDIWCPRPYPIGIGLQLLDLGAIASVGFASDTEVKPDASFSDVVSPGIQIAVGLGNSPFVLALNASWAPALREKTANEMTQAFDAWRYMLSLEVDVPIFVW